MTQKLPSSARRKPHQRADEALIEEASRGAWGPAVKTRSPVTNWLLAALVLLLACGYGACIYRATSREVGCAGDRRAV